MKKTLVSIVGIISMIGIAAASDSGIPQVVTSEVFTEQIQVTEESYYPTRVNLRNFDSTYCKYKDDRNYCNRRVIRRPQTLQPIAVHTGKTVTIQDHYEVYQPKVIYEKVGRYTTTKVCEYCK